MGQTTAIEWCHHTLNIFRGRAKVHAGCTNGYAEKNVGVRMNGIAWGEVWQGGQRVVMADSGWKAPMKWARDAARAGERRRVFCSSRAAVLEVPAVPEEWPAALKLSPGDISIRKKRIRETAAAMDAARARLWDVIRQTHRIEWDLRGERVSEGGLDWLLLTKRPENWHLVPEDVRRLVWLGTSISDQKTADEWVPRLLAAEGFRLRFLSVEPLVGPVDLSRWLPGKRWYMCRCRDCGYTASSGTFREAWSIGGDADVVCPRCDSVRNDADVPGIDWVIVGGESGSKARPCAVEWVRDIVRQCREAGVPCFVKQLGSEPAASIAPTGNFRTNPETGRRQLELAVTPLDLTDPKGGDMAEWPEDIRVRELPQAA